MLRRRFLSIFLAMVAATAVCITSAFAVPEPTIPHTHGTEEEATVSEEEDTATNSDPSMSTNFYMYIPPDPTFEDVPQMGDLGMDPNRLLLAAMLLGVVYLGCSQYAYSNRRQEAC